jgi:hypothetical protein
MAFSIYNQSKLKFFLILPNYYEVFFFSKKY